MIGESCDCHLYSSLSTDSAMAILPEFLTLLDFRWLPVHLRLWRNTFGYPARLNSTAIFNLSDEPSVHATWSGGGPGRLPGMRRNSKLWSPKRNRYLLDKEILEAFGVPVSEQHARQCGIQPYVIPADVPLSDVVGFLDVFGFIACQLVTCLYCLSTYFFDFTD